MEITRKRDVTLVELLPMVWDNKFDYLVFESNQGGFITFDVDKMIEHHEKFIKACDDFMKGLDRTLHFTQFTKWLAKKLNDLLK